MTDNLFEKIVIILIVSIMIGSVIDISTLGANTDYAAGEEVGYAEFPNYEKYDFLMEQLPEILIFPRYQLDEQQMLFFGYTKGHQSAEIQHTVNGIFGVNDSENHTFAVNQAEEDIRLAAMAMGV